MRMMNFKMPLYPARIRVFFCLNDFYAKYPEEAYKDATGFKAFVCEKEGVICIVFIAYTDATLAHESVHAAWAVLNWTGVKVSYDNDEPLAYCVDYIFGKVQAHRQKELTKCD